MRLSSNEITVITSEVKRHFGVESHVLLFGSRIDDSKKGGDIDLLIRGIDILEPAIIVRKKINFLVELEKLLGDQKIDLLVEAKNDPRAIIQTAIRTGISLC